MTDQNLGVVVGVDGSRRALAATAFAAGESQRLGVPLTLVHVLPTYVPMAPMLPLMPDDLSAVGTYVLSEATQHVHDVAPGVDVSTRLLHGSPVSELVELSADARMLVLGHESSPTWTRVFTGAVTIGVAARAHCPVVSVPSRPVVDGPQGSVVVGFKSAEHDSDLLAHAFASAAALGARLTILHAWELPGCYDDIIVRRTHEADWNSRARAHLEELISRLRGRHPDVEVEVRITHQQPAYALREASRSADRLVLTRRGDGAALFHLGGTARALLREAACPVVIVPSVPAGASDPSVLLEQEGAPVR